MPRRYPKSHRIKRRGATKEPKKRILIVCEGRKTEPEYIKDFSRDKKHPLVECITIEGIGAPKSIVDRAIEEKGELQRKARKSGNSFDKNHEVWCVSDMDEHPSVQQEMQRANDNGLKYALSNPCIELWAFLHYSQNDAPRHRHDMQRMLTDVMPAYEHSHGATFDYAHMKRGYADAVTRARELTRRREEENTPHENPSTNIYLLMESICDIKEAKKGVGDN